MNFSITIVVPWGVLYVGRLGMDPNHRIGIWIGWARNKETGRFHKAWEKECMFCIPGTGN